MKKTDLAMIILIASLSILVAYFAGNALFGNFKEQPTKVKTVERFDTTVEEPDERIFNDQAINPTVEIIVGQDGQQ